MEELLSRWDDIKASIQKEYLLTDISYKTWIKPLEIFEVNEDVVTILIPSDKARSADYIRNKYYWPIQVGVSEALHKECDIRFVMQSDIDAIVVDTDDSSTRIPTNSMIYENSMLDPQYSFDTFVVGSNNNLAHSGALAVAESPGCVYNPLFLYGGAGLGKTHLLHAIGNFVIQNNPSVRVMFVSSEEFTNELVNAIRIGKESPEVINRFRDKYRNIDILLFDDIQFIIGKDRTQIEFFNTFEKLYKEKKQIVISSDKPPKDMELLEERLKSRFNWGLTIDIQRPDYETRVAILKKKCEMGGYRINDEIIEYIANAVDSNIRELEGSLNKINAYYILGERHEITMDMVKDALKDMVSPNTPRIISPRHILDVVCEHLDISPEDVMSKKRNEEIATARHIVMYLCAKYTELSSTKIGEFLGRDHSTVLHGTAKVESNIECDEVMRNRISIIARKLNVNEL